MATAAQGDRQSRAITAFAARTRGESADRVICALLVMALGWLPFWDGSNELAAWGINSVVFAAIAALCEFALLLRGGHHSFGLRHIALSAILFALVLAWVFAQTLTWKGSLVTDPIWEMTANALNKKVAGGVSIDRDLTSLALLRLVTAALVFWTALQLCRNSTLAKFLLKCLTAISSLYAAFGLVALNLSTVRLPWATDAVSAGMVSSSFVNRNSFAAYAGLGLVATWGLAAQLYRKEVARAGTRRLAIAAGIEAAGRKGVFLIAAGFLITVALLLTGSRGGVGATAVGLFVLAVSAPKPGERRMISPAPLIVLACVTGAGLLFAFGDPLIASLRDRGVTDTNRASVYWLTLQSIADRPFLGHGYGTFADVFPMYRDRSISVVGVWEQAHNTYLEIFQGLGLVFGSMLIASIVLLVWHCLKGATTRRENSTLPRVACAAAVLVGVHSLVDFSLQIQAVALTFAAILGAGVAQAQSTRLDLQD